MLIPLVTYTSSILDALNIYDTDTNADLFSYYIFQSLTTLSGGVLFAVCFYYVAKKLPTSPIRTFLTISAIGFVLLYLSNNVSVSIASYPPYRINALSLLPLASYLVLVGLYASALHLSHDLSLRKRIRSLALSDSNLLSSIGTAQMDREITRTVDKIMVSTELDENELKSRRHLPVDLGKSDIEEYVRQVVNELAKTSRRKRSA
jgi:hypothetical protein